MISKKKLVIVASVLVALLLLSTFAVAQILQNVDTDTYKVQAQKDFDNARIQVEQIRNASFSDNLHLYVITKQEAVDRWGKPSADANLALIQRQ